MRNLTTNTPRLLITLLTGVIVVLCLTPGGAQGAGMPDGRVYERVSPVGTSGGTGGVFPLGTLTHSIEQYGHPLQSSVNGEAVSYLGEDYYQSRLGSLNQYLSLQGASGWLTQNLTLGISSSSESAAEANSTVALSPDLSKAVISSRAPLAVGAPLGFANLYLRQGTEIQPLLTSQPQHRTAQTFGHAWPGLRVARTDLLFAGANLGTADTPAFSHILFEANDALTSNAVDGGEFENNLYEWSKGGIRLVNVLPNKETNANASFGVENGDEYTRGVLPSLSNVISADGSKIFWTDENTGNLYVRENGERTQQVDSSVGGGGEFQTASADGSRVLFTKGGNLYQFDTNSGLTSKIAGGGVEGLLGASQDGTYVYFVATTVLDGAAVEGQPNLYLAHGGKLIFIATLSPADNETPTNIYGTATPYGDWFRTFAGRTAEVSPNGEYVAFISREKLTGYESFDAAALRNDYEVFIYNAATRTLSCASCNIDGTRPTSDTLLPPPVDGVYQQRYLTDSGHLFFSTQNAVLPQDINGKLDIYEYEDGHVYLLSPGTANAEAVFADASETGNDVFFTTREPLVAGDSGEITNLYDARVDGRQAEPTTPACSSEACHAPSAAPPSFATPPSAIFVGSGNLLPPISVPVRAKKVHAVKKQRKKHRRSRKQARKSSTKRSGRLG